MRMGFLFFGPPLWNQNPACVLVCGSVCKAILPIQALHTDKALQFQNKPCLHWWNFSMASNSPTHSNIAGVRTVGVDENASSEISMSMSILNGGNFNNNVLLFIYSQMKHLVCFKNSGRIQDDLIFEFKHFYVFPAHYNFCFDHR